MQGEWCSIAIRKTYLADLEPETEPGTFVGWWHSLLWCTNSAHWPCASNSIERQRVLTRRRSSRDVDDDAAALVVAVDARVGVGDALEGERTVDDGAVLTPLDQLGQEAHVLPSLGAHAPDHPVPSTTALEWGRQEPA